jgi:hypothetical protein
VCKFFFVSPPLILRGSKRQLYFFQRAIAMSRGSILVKILRQGILTLWILFFVPLPIEAADTTTHVHSRS